MRKPSGYTLLELSMVLIIIALIVSGVLWGMGVLRNAQMRSTITDFDRYQHALQQFYDKYNEMPGDMADATNFWNIDTVGCPGTWNPAPHTTTCNGDGNGRISPRDFDDGIFDPNGLDESFRAWQQLYDAGMINLAMTGTPGPGGNMDAQVGLNVPQGYASGVGYVIYYLQCYGAPGSQCTAYFPAQYGHVIEAGRRSTASNDYTHAPFLSAQEAASIDSKIDDGIPSSGKVLVPATETSCVSTTTPSTATYNIITDSTAVCSLIYITGM